MWVLVFMSASDVEVFRSSPHRPPRTELSHGALATLLSEEKIHCRLRDAPVATIELVGALEAAMLAPIAHSGCRSVEPGSQLSHREVGLRGHRLVGLVAVRRREGEQPVSRECQRAPDGRRSA